LLSEVLISLFKVTQDKYKQDPFPDMQCHNLDLVK